ncbi:MAG: DUF4339 domain-containing protein [Acidobacteriales bacterium]|nr:DUF4339 domain-containing protein [Terriglobales bacterium]
MNYYVKRGDQQYGPYSLADLQRYVQQGNIAPTDLARSEGMQNWVPVSQVLGNIAIPSAPTGFGATQAAPAANLNPPPNLHWGVVLLLSIITCYIFYVIWLFVQAAWVKKIRPGSRAILYFVLYILLIFGAVAVEAQSPDSPLPALLYITAIVLAYCGIFSMRRDIESYYNSEENIGLQLSGVMTFFFTVWYFQYHFNRINGLKQTGVLQ